MTPEANGKSTRKGYRMTDRDIEDLETIRSFLENKFGVSDESAAVRAAIRHYADHIRKGELH